jgi:hypothetical protein
MFDVLESGIPVILGLQWTIQRIGRRPPRAVRPATAAGLSTRSGCAEGSSLAQVEPQMRSWHSSAGVSGGFQWLYDDIKACSAADYARAVGNAIGD